jgi:hypothetical protein
MFSGGCGRACSWGGHMLRDTPLRLWIPARFWRGARPRGTGRLEEKLPMGNRSTMLCVRVGTYLRCGLTQMWTQ